MDAEATTDAGSGPVTLDSALWYQMVARALAQEDAEKVLSSRLHDGFAIKPLYGRHNTDVADIAPPGLAPFIRGGAASGAVVHGWDIQQEFKHPDLQVTNQELLEDLENGVTSVLLKCDATAQHGTDTQHVSADDTTPCDGILMFTADDLDTALAGILLEAVPVNLQMGNGAWAGAAFLQAVWRKRGLATHECSGSFNIDPVGTLARTGLLIQGHEQALKDLGIFTRRTVQHFPYVGVAAADGTIWSDAGATDCQEIACTLSTALLYLRAMMAAGLEAEEACSRICFVLTTGTDLFAGIAKLRAARMAWARVASACGASGPATSMRLRATTASRILCHRDPWTNILRATLAGMAAVLGGAGSITTLPPDAASRFPSRDVRRIARNIQHILRDESGIGRVLDPAGGSWFLETLTQQVAETAWTHFQELERHGGILPSLLDGSLQQMLDAAWESRTKAVGCHADLITGVNRFPSPDRLSMPEQSINHYALRKGVAARLRTVPETVQANGMDAFFHAAETARLSGLTAWIAGNHQPTSLAPLPCRRVAEEFESLQDASDHAARTNKRPAIFLAYTDGCSDAMTFARHVLLSGGLDVVECGRPESVDAMTSRLEAHPGLDVCLCTSPDLWPSLCERLRRTGIRHITAVTETHVDWPGADTVLSRTSHTPDFLRACLHRAGAWPHVIHS
ncbi:MULTISPECIES: methylmalonyl-CoA mutase family protein [unclassified Haematospirillum]|uniref:methylmalonyl-CoA mutase family protein n=1 Tax=unclassified Haematospirillum TaxID=2622088 RepID=UPI00143899B3|nr:MULTISPECIES: methylmalonyl-CoA mutase family protein [unclassified Haematospirillum]NKD54087.1 methylmalonyl-CoA mutase [Haematospirillum sp. H4890]NKD74132.1 methylmalonyl-CoA mutase [Haematospirillum sp. H4485]NKD87198.1 methylmalonyl-CoA mutase [Haematospirillum sp. 15-248]